MMKKMLSFIAAFLVIGGALFADVLVKDLGDGNAEVTFLYKGAGNEVVVAGDFTDWQNGALPMTKTDNGFELTKTFPMNTTLKYKFIVDGSWLFDAKSPDKTDDGFGGFNGVVDIAKLVTVEKAKASGDTAALDKLLASQSGLKFGTFTQLNVISNFITRNIQDPTKKGLETDSVQFKAKSYWKLSGTLLPDAPAYIEIQAFDGTKDIYKVDPTGTVTVKAEDGLNALATGLLFNPFNYLQGGDPALGHFKAGVNTSYVNVETAYKWAKPSTRSTIIWTTITDGDSKDGYLQFTNGSALQSFGDLKLDVGIVPNKTLGTMGLRSWVAATYGDYTAEVQWDAKSTAADQTKVTDFFDSFTGDLIAGVKGAYGPVSGAVQFIMPVASSAVEDAFGYQANVTYTSLMFGATAKFGSFQPSVSSLYGNNSDDDNIVNNQSFIVLNPWVLPMEGLKAGIDTKLNTTSDLKFADKNLINLKPYVSLDFDKLLGYTFTVDAYGKMDLDLADGASETFKFNEVGLKYAMTEVSDIIPSFDVNYGLQMGDVKMFNTLMANVATKAGVNLNAGLGLRTTNDKATQADKDKNETLACYLGANYKVASLKNGVFYGAFVYNMDPYDDDKDELKMSDYRPDTGIDDMAGYAKFRMGVKWDF